MSTVQVKLTEFSDLITWYTADFVGREWLVKQVNALLDDPGCRLVVLTGGPGVGKTAFLAHLAANHTQWPRYFIRRDSKDLLRPGDAITFLLTIGGQLATLYPQLFHPENLEVVTRQRIGNVEAGGEATGARIEELHASPFYRVALLVEQEIQRVAGKATGIEIGRLITEPRLMQLQDLQYMGLLDPARLLAKEQPDAQIVVLVDALDELCYSPAEPDILRALRDLPELPPNVRFVVSSRPDTFLAPLLARSDVRELPLDMVGDDNRVDLQTYVENIVTGNAVKAIMATEQIEPNEFTHGLLIKAAGNFLYVKSVLGGIQQALEYPTKRERLVHLLRVEELPGELSGLYGHFLAFIVKWAQDEFGAKAWREYLRPLLGVLAVAHEPLSEELILSFSGLKQEDIRDLLRELHQFVETLDGEPLLYRIYHTSFAEYLIDSEHNRDYWIDGREKHGYIADRYLDSWGGFESGLAGLQNTTEHDLENSEYGFFYGYGIDYLSMHLLESGKIRELQQLPLNSSWMQARVIHADYRYDGYLDDLKLAWDFVKNRVDTDKDALVYCLRYAFLWDRIHGQVQHYPSDLVARAVVTGAWSVGRALSHLAKVGDSDQRAKTAVALLRTGKLNEKEIDWVVRDGLITIIFNSSGAAHERNKLLASFLPYMDNELLEKVLDAVLAWDNASEEEKGSAVCVIANHLDEKFVPRIVDFALNMDDEYVRVRTLGAIIPRLKGDLIDRVLKSTRRIKDMQARLAIEVLLLPVLLPRQQHRYARKILDATLLLRLAENSSLSDSDDELLYSMPYFGISIALLPFLSEQKKNSTLNLILQRSQYLLKMPPRRYGAWAKVVAGCLPFMNEAQIESVLDQARNITVLERIPLILPIAPYWDETRKREVIEQDFASIFSPGSFERYDIIEVLLPFLGDASRDQVLKFICAEIIKTSTELLEDPTAEGFEAMEILSKASYQDSLIKILGLLVEYLSETMQEFATQTVFSIPTVKFQRKGIEQIAKILNGNELQYALKQMEYRDDGDLICYTITLAKLSPYFSINEQNKIREYALNAALCIGDGDRRATSLMEICPYLGIGNQLFDLYLDAIPQLPSVSWGLGARDVVTVHPNNEWNPRAFTLAKLIPFLNKTQINKAFEIAQTIPIERYSAHVISSLSGDLPDADIYHCQEIVWSYKDDSARVLALSALMPRLNGASQKKAVKAFDKYLKTLDLFQDTEKNIGILAGLLPYLATADREKYVKDALNAILNSKNEHECELALIALSKFLPSEWYPDILDRVSGMSAGRGKGSWDDGLHCPRAGALVALAPQIPESLLPEILRLATEISSIGLTVRVQIRVLLALLPRLKGIDFEKTLNSCLELALQAPDMDLALSVNPRALFLRLLAPYLQNEMWDRAFSEAQKLENSWQAWTLAAFLDNAKEPLLVRTAARESISKYIISLKYHHWDSALKFITHNDLLTPKCFSQDELFSIGEFLIDIFENWRWL